METATSVEISNIRRQWHPEIFLLILVPVNPQKPGQAPAVVSDPKDRILVIHVDPGDDLAAIVGPIVIKLNAERSQLSVPSHLTDTMSVTSVRTAIQQAVAHLRLTRLSNLIRFRCCLHNLPSIIQRNHRPGMPSPFMAALVCGAGPSLAEQTEVIRRFQGKAMIVAVGHAVGTLMRANVVPDYVVEVDPACHVNWRNNLQVPASCLVAAVMASPFVCHWFESVVWTAADFSGLNEFLENFGIPLFSVEFSRTVMVSAIDFCATLGCRTIALVGSDLALGESGCSHSDGTLRSHGEQQWERMGIDGRTVRVTQELDVLRQSLEAYLERLQNRRQGRDESLEIINCSARGVPIRGTTPMFLSGFLARLDRCGEHISNIPVASRRNLPDVLDAIQSDFIRFRESIRLAISCMNSLLDALSSPETGGNSIRNLQAELHERFPLITELSRYPSIAQLLETTGRHIDSVLNEMPIPPVEPQDAIGALTVLRDRFSLFDELLDDIGEDLNSIAENDSAPKWNQSTEPLPFIFSGFRRQAIRFVAENNQEYADFLAARSFSPEELDTFRLRLFWTEQPQGWKTDNTGMARSVVNGAYLSMRNVAEQEIREFLDGHSFRQDHDALVLFLPSTWLHPEIIAARFPKARMTIIDPWPALFSRIIDHAQFLHRLPPDTLILAADKRMNPWQKRLHGQIRTWRRQKLRILFFINPIISDFPELAPVLTEIDNLLSG